MYLVIDLIKKQLHISATLSTKNIFKNKKKLSIKFETFLFDFGWTKRSRQVFLLKSKAENCFYKFLKFVFVKIAIYLYLRIYYNKKVSKLRVMKFEP